MIDFAKKFTAGILTALLLVSNYPSGISASSVEPGSDPYIVLEDVSVDEEDTEKETPAETEAPASKETQKPSNDEAPAEDNEKSGADETPAEDPAVNSGKADTEEAPAEQGNNPAGETTEEPGTPSTGEPATEPGTPSTGDPSTGETPTEPSEPSKPFTAPAGATLTYRTRARYKKWEKKYKPQGNLAGSVNKKRTLEAVQMKFKSSTSGKLQYRVHTYKYGWSAYKTNGQTAGRKGGKLDQIQIRLTGQLAQKYDIYYRVHVRTDNGWTNWAKNGESAGAIHYARFIEAIQVVLTEKDAGAPGDVANIKSEREGALITAYDIKEAMTEKAQSMTSKTKWLILCDTSKYFVGVFKGSQGNWKMVRFIYVAVGKPSTPTKKGTFYLRKKKKKFFADVVRCKYCSSFKGSYYFHSWPYYWNGKKVYSPVLGKGVSHGCVRMATDDAKYIYKKVPLKTKVVVY
ncbi:MAG: L,D-transpeptidase family protein [Clostridiales bacterium]|nr:L,D-transpeptidase family protein [Clostridiales bacterium]